MVLCVVNLQEAYAKALLVDRDALRGRPGRPATCSAATRSCSTPTAPTCARCARRCAPRRGAAEDPVARPARVRLRASARSPSADADVAVAGGWGR